MEREQILTLYTWDTGICFRHPDLSGIDTARVSRIKPRSGPAEEIRACRTCVLEMEAAREADAGRRGEPYFPGRLADPEETP